MREASERAEDLDRGGEQTSVPDTHREPETQKLCVHKCCVDCIFHPFLRLFHSWCPSSGQCVEGRALALGISESPAQVLACDRCSRTRKGGSPEERAAGRQPWCRGCEEV